MRKHKLYYIYNIGLLLAVQVTFSFNLSAQSNNHWSRNFNEESSLLSGAVVGGGAGPAAIFYNPATISEIKESKFSLNVSLFAFELLKANNAWGDGIDLKYNRGVVVPRFLSYMLKPKRLEKWSFEVAFLNNSDYSVQDTKSFSQQIDVLNRYPGEERYDAYYKYLNKYRDNWIGIGGSVQVADHLYLGTSMFVSYISKEYIYDVETEAVPDLEIPDQYSFNRSIAHSSEHEFVKFYDYRLLFKVGLLYKKERLSLGLNITTPSIGQIYSNGKEVFRKRSQGNIANPTNDELLPDILISSYKEKNEVMVNAKSTFSIATGLTYTNSNENKTLFLTGEYFAGIDPYRMVEAKGNRISADNEVSDIINLNEWLTFVSGAKPIFNFATGYRWLVKENLMILTGFRTDFNYSLNESQMPSSLNSFKQLNLNKYHVTSGLNLRIMGQDLIAGFQYTYGVENNKKQFANFSHPNEFNSIDNSALQGIRQHIMNSRLSTITIYFGATININQRRTKQSSNSN